MVMGITTKDWVQVLGLTIYVQVLAQVLMLHASESGYEKLKALIERCKKNLKHTQYIYIGQILVFVPNTNLNLLSYFCRTFGLGYGHRKCQEILKYFETEKKQQIFLIRI